MTSPIQKIAKVVMAFCLVSAGSAAGAADIAGAWSTNLSDCKSLFVKSGSSVKFTKGAGIAGSGFIVAGNRITGRLASCSIGARKEDGAVLHLLTTCSTGVALEAVQLSVRIVGDNEIIRIFPGMDALNTAYYRCPM
jgi:hypothetical protein